MFRPCNGESECIPCKIICNECKLRGPHQVPKTWWGKEQPLDSNTARTVCASGDVKGDLRRRQGHCDGGECFISSLTLIIRL